MVTPTSQSCPQPRLSVTGTWCCSGMCNSQTACLQGMTNLILFPGMETNSLPLTPKYSKRQYVQLNCESKLDLFGKVWILQCFQPSHPFLKPHLLLPGSTTSWICPFLLFKGSQNHHVIHQHIHTGKMMRLILFLMLIRLPTFYRQREDR